MGRSFFQGKCRGTLRPHAAPPPAFGSIGCTRKIRRTLPTFAMGKPRRSVSELVRDCVYTHMYIYIYVCICVHTHMYMSAVACSRVCDCRVLSVCLCDSGFWRSYGARDKEFPPGHSEPGLATPKIFAGEDVPSWFNVPKTSARQKKHFGYYRKSVTYSDWPLVGTHRGQNDAQRVPPQIDTVEIIFTSNRSNASARETFVIQRRARAR